MIRFNASSSVKCHPWRTVCARAMSLQSCLTLCTPGNCRPPSCSVFGVLQARILQWSAVPSRGSSRPGDRNHLSCFQHWQAGSLPLAPPARAMCIYIYKYTYCIGYILSLYTHIHIYVYMQYSLLLQSLKPHLSMCGQSENCV